MHDILLALQSIFGLFDVSKLGKMYAMHIA